MSGVKTRFRQVNGAGAQTPVIRYLPVTATGRSCNTVIRYILFLPVHGQDSLSHGLFHSECDIAFQSSDGFPQQSFDSTSFSLRYNQNVNNKGTRCMHLIYRRILLIRDTYLHDE